MAELTAEQITKMIEVMGLLSRTLTQIPDYREETNPNGTVGTNTKAWSKVEPGKVLFITHISAYDQTNAPTRIRLGFHDRRQYKWAKVGIAPLTTETVEFNGLLILGEGMRPAVRWEGVTADDDLHAIVMGYWVDIKRGI